MKNTLRKLIPLIFLAVISLTVVLPSAVFLAPQPVYAADPVATPTTTPTTASPATTSPATINNSATKAKTGTDSVEVGWVGNSVIQAVGAVVQILISVLGTLTVSLIHILLMVASYNDYMVSPAITRGWVIVRDVANLFFVAIILIVSIGSIVNPERFGGVKKVFRVLLYALLVNFSRTIAGIFIDISQLIMLTFVNGFAQAAGGNFVEALGITKITDISAGTTAVTFASTMGQLLLGLFMFVIITVIIGIIVVALVVRMVTLWMLVVLSPLAFALGSSDITHQHYAEWWKKFSAELTTGPIVAFFLWLSLVTFQSSEGSKIVGQNGLVDGAKGAEPVTIDCGQGLMCGQENLVRFIVATAMLLLGLSFAREFSGLGKTLADAAASKGKQYARGAMDYVGKQSWAGAKKVGGVGLSATGIPLAANKLGDVYSSAKSRAGRFIGRGSSVPVVGGWFRGMAAPLINSSADRDAKKLEDARKKTRNFTPEMRAGVLGDPMASAADKKSVAMSIANDKVYEKASFDGDEAEKKRAELFEKAVSMLAGITEGRDKDVDAKMIDLREKRPDLVPAGKALADIAAGLDRDKFLKINWSGIPKTKREQLMKLVSPDIVNEAYKRAPGSLRKYIDDARMPVDSTPAQLEAMVKAGNIDFTGVQVEVPAQAAKAATATTPATVATPAHVNTEVAKKVAEFGTHEQMKDLRDNSKSSVLRDALVEEIKAGVDFTKAGSSAGFTAANDRVDGAKLRGMEAAVVLGESADKLYMIDKSGDFTDPRAKNSFDDSTARTTSQKLDFVLRLPSNKLKGETFEVLYKNVSNDELGQMAKLAKTPDEIAVLGELINGFAKQAEAIYQNTANTNAQRNIALARMEAIADHPELSRLMS